MLLSGECFLNKLWNTNNSVYLHISYQRKPSPWQELPVFLKVLDKEQDTDSLLLCETLKLERGLKGSRWPERSTNHFSNCSTYCRPFLAVSSKWISDPGKLVFLSEAAFFLKMSFVLKAGKTAQWFLCLFGFVHMKEKITIAVLPEEDAKMWPSGYFTGLLI